jgi:hypothetical protein
MKPADLNHLHDAQQHLLKARYALKRLSLDGKVTISKVIEQKTVEQIEAELTALDDLLGNAHTDIKRLSIGR